MKSHREYQWHPLWSTYVTRPGRQVYGGWIFITVQPRFTYCTMFSHITETWIRGNFGVWILVERQKCADLTMVYNRSLISFIYKPRFIEISLLSQISFWRWRETIAMAQLLLRTCHQSSQDGTVYYFFKPPHQIYTISLSFSIGLLLLMQCSGAVLRVYVYQGHNLHLRPPVVFPAAYFHTFVQYRTGPRQARSQWIDHVPPTVTPVEATALPYPGRGHCLPLRPIISRSIGLSGLGTYCLLPVVLCNIR